MPLTAAAFAAGRIGAEHVTVLVRARTRDVVDEFAAAEADLVAAAETKDFDEFDRTVRDWRSFVQPDRSERRAKEAEQRREGHASRTFDGLVRVDSWLDPLGGTEFLDELGRIEQELFEADWAEARRPGRRPRHRPGPAPHRPPAPRRRVRRDGPPFPCPRPYRSRSRLGPERVDGLAHVLRGGRRHPRRPHPHHQRPPPGAHPTPRPRPPPAPTPESTCPDCGGATDAQPATRPAGEAHPRRTANCGAGTAAGADPAGRHDDPARDRPPRHRDQCRAGPGGELDPDGHHDPTDDLADQPPGRRSRASRKPDPGPHPEGHHDHIDDPPDRPPEPYAGPPPTRRHGALPDWWHAPDPFAPGFAHHRPDTLCELEDYTPLAPSQALGLGIAGEIRRMVFGPDGEVLDFGTTRPYPTGALREAVRLRDRECRDPGCTVPGHHCQIDHVIPRSRGGPTSITNLRCQCGGGNRLKGTGPPLAS